jgi:hypothetical protein
MLVQRTLDSEKKVLRPGGEPDRELPERGSEGLCSLFAHDAGLNGPASQPIDRAGGGTGGAGAAPPISISSSLLASTPFL